MIRLLVVEDNNMMRNALECFLGADPEIQLVGAASGFGEAILLAKTLSPDVVLLDLHVDDEDSMTTGMIKSALGGCEIVAMSFEVDTEARTIADQLGAVVLVDKMNLSEDLIPSIKQCAKFLKPNGNNAA